MKKSLLVQLTVLLFSFAAMAQGPFQQSISANGKNYHDLNMEPIEDGSRDLIIAGNMFDTTMSNEEMTLQRVEEDGSVVWIQKYVNTPLNKARVFDIVIDGNIFLTGSVDVGGMKQMFIAEVDVTTGTMLVFNEYAVVSPNFNSRGLKIIATNSDVDGDAIGDPGFVIGGFFSDCYALDATCMFNNLGFVMRVDINLVPMWTIEIDANNPINNQDYDFVNGITETNDGFLITGSTTGVITNTVRQAVLARKIDFSGITLWDMSYIFGNSQDVSVDAYYDAATDEIFMLTNYSSSHSFGITVLANSTGAINTTNSWFATGNHIDLYGFTLMESSTSVSNLVITGYDRDENWIDVNSNSQFANSSVFAYEFEKATGDQSGPAYQFLVPHVEPTPEEFNFWDGQLPLIYYPDMGFPAVDADGSVVYYHVGYRTAASETNIELFKTGFDHRNVCEHLSININHSPISILPVPVMSGGVSAIMTPSSINTVNYAVGTAPCDAFLAVADISTTTTTLYPNPASTHLNFAGPQVNEYRLIDALGRIVSEGKLDDQTSLYVGNLTKGMYFITLIGDNNTMTTLKFIKD